MGTAYEVWDKTLHQRCVMKVPLLTSLEEKILNRFRLEACIGANLNRAHAAAVQDLFEVSVVGHSEPVPILIMNKVEGENLEELLMIAREERKSPLPTNLYDSTTAHKVFETPQKCLNIIYSILEAIQSAHDRDIIHRDIKPGNIMVNAEGKACLLDFGISTHKSLVDDQEGPKGFAPIPEKYRMTVAGTFMGTVEYLSPEELTGTRHDQPKQRDIFAAALVAFEVLTGGIHPLSHFHEEEVDGKKIKRTQVNTNGIIEFISPGEIYGLTIDQIPYFAELMKDVPELYHFIEPVLRKGMHPDPAERYTSIAEFSRALKKAESDYQIYLDIQDSLEHAEHQLDEAKAIMKAIEQVENELTNTWNRFNFNNTLTQEFWEKMNDPISTLREAHGRWLQIKYEVISFLEKTFANRTKVFSDAMQTIVKTVFDLLTKTRTRLSLAEKDALIDKITKYADLDPDNPELRLYRETVQANAKTKDYKGKIPIEIEVVFPFGDVPSTNYEITLKLFDLSPDQPVKQISPLLAHNCMYLPAGKYGLEVGIVSNDLNYRPTRTQIYLKYDDVLNHLKNNSSLKLRVPVVREKNVPNHMILIPAKKAFLGFDFYDNQINPMALFASPGRFEEHEDFAIAQFPTIIEEYKSFLQAAIDEVNDYFKEGRFQDGFEKLLQTASFLPRNDRILDTNFETKIDHNTLLALIRELRQNKENDKKIDELLKALLREINAHDIQNLDIKDNRYWKIIAEWLELNSFHWKLKLSTEGNFPSLSLQDPNNTTLPNSTEPILNDQPVHSITYNAMEAYAAWKTKEDHLPSGLAYQIMSADEFEIAFRMGDKDRDFPSGTQLNLLAYDTRLPISDRAGGTYPAAVHHPRRAEHGYGDQTFAGVCTLMSIRQITRTGAETGTKVYVGMNPNVPAGPSAFAFSRPYTSIGNGKAASAQYHGFRLVLNLKKPVVSLAGARV